MRSKTVAIPTFIGVLFAAALYADEDKSANSYRCSLKSIHRYKLLVATLVLSGCDSVGFGPRVPKCDDPDALKLTANLSRSKSGTRDGLFGLPVNLIADHSLASTEMILNQKINKEIGKSSCAA